MQLFPISSLRLQFGSNGQPLVVDQPAVTVFVGPNNSGKSLVLKELALLLRNGNVDGQILHSVSTPDLTGELADQIVARTLRRAGVPLDVADEFQFSVQSNPMLTVGCSKRSLYEALRNPIQGSAHYVPILLAAVALDGSTRLHLVAEQNVPSLSPPTTSFARLAVNDVARSKLQSILFEAFGKYLIFDLTQRPGTAKLSYSDEAPTPSLERSWSDESISFFKASVPIDQFSDGVRAFTGILVELFAGDPSVLMIDEPEAFLHPSLAFLLGREIARPIPGVAQKNVFVATHSPSFLMGCIQSGAAVNVVRLARSGGVPTARLLDAESLRVLMRNPLLRSVGAIEALFYDFVVVTEADSDRAFYDEVNHRLVMAGDKRGISNCLFLRAQNKHTVPGIIRPLRALGIPAAGIVDLDVYEEGGKIWSNLVDSAGMDATTAAGTAIVRSRVKAAFEKSESQPPKVCGGVALLEGEERRAADNLFDQLDDYGIFTVRRGELEHWLPGIAPEKFHGPSWLVEAFKNMGAEVAQPSYMQPSNGDVWDFIGRVGEWLKAPKRKGML